MKKTISIFLMFIMLMNIAPFFAVASSTESNLIFEMDLSQYENEKTITNSVLGNESSVTVNGEPTLGVTEGEQNYLTFRTASGGSENAITIADENFANQDLMSFELWVRGTELKSGGQSGSICSLALGNTTGDLTFDIFNAADGDFWYRMNGLKSAHKMTQTMIDYNDCWTHIVFTKKWNPTTSSSANGTWTGELYINGEEIQTFTSTAETTRDDETGLYLTVGNKCTNNTAFYGDIATFKVYNTILDSNSIQLKYDTGISSFKEKEANVAFKNTTDGSVVEYLDGLENVAVSYENIKESADVFVGFYDGDNVLLDVIKREVSSTGSVNIDIAKGTKYIKAFLWENNILKPMTNAFSIGYSEGYRTYVFAYGGFYNESGEEISALDNEDIIIAKAVCSSVEPERDVFASLTLHRENISIKLSEVCVDLKNGEAEISLPVEGVELSKGDVVTFRIYDSAKSYFTKTIGYENLSDTVDILLVAGQSNALGQGGNSADSIKTEPGTVYYQTMGNDVLATTGERGWVGSLGKTWHDETGHTVLIVKAAWGGTGFPSLVENVKLGSDTYGYWNPVNNGSISEMPYDCYTLAKNYYNAAVNSIDTNQYTIGECVYFWNQGENENSQYTAEDYEDAFSELHQAILTEFGTEETRIVRGGIIPVRSSVSDGVPANLKLSGPRIAQYRMAHTRDDLCIVSDAIEHWCSDSSIEEWFKNSSGYYYSEIPDEWHEIMSSKDDLHYTQLAMNEFGREAAINMLTYISGGTQVTGIDLITPEGIRHYNDGDSIYLTEDGVIPHIPSANGKKAVFELNGSGAEINENGILVAKPALLNDDTMLTVKIEGQNSMNFNLYSPLVDETIEIAPIKDNKSAIYTLTTDDGHASTNLYLDSKLKELGLVGTLGLVPGYLGTETSVAKYMTWEEAEQLVNNEDSVWDVANHTLNHLQSEFLQLSEEELEKEIDGGRETLLEHFPGEKIISMYTPGGQTSELIREKVKENHFVLRRAGGGFNNLPATENNLLSLSCQAVGEFAGSDITVMNAWVDTAIAGGKWLCEMWHGVGEFDAANWGGNIGEEVADEHLTYVAQKKEDGKLWVTTLDEAAIYAVQRINSQIKMVTNDTGYMKFTLSDEKSKYTSELTLNVTLPDGATATSVMCNGSTISYTASEGKVSFNVLPNNGNIEIKYEE